MLTTLWSGTLSVIIFLLVLGGIVLVHEFGHYLAGRLQGFAIEAFSIGFGPKVFELKGAYNRWQLRWLLFGGFVKFAGETEDAEEGEEEAPAPDGPGEFFFAKPRWRRFLVMVMGVVFNTLLAYVLFAGLAAVGWEESVLRDRPAVIGWVAQDSPAAKAGVLRGDEILSIDGRPVPNWEAAREDIALNQKPYTLVVNRAGDKVPLQVTPAMGTFLKQPVADIGVYPALPPVIGGIYPDSPAAKAGLKPGDRLVSLDGETFAYWDEFQQLMAKGGGEARRFVIERAGAPQPLDLTITPEWNEQAGRFLVGVAPQETVWVRYGFPGNMVKAFHVTVEQSTLAYRTLKRLLERKVALSALSGPVSIAYITGEVARTGLYNLLMLVAIISLQLAFFNLLPIPGLDGGQMFILAAEGAARRDLPARIKDRILMAGFVLLIGFFAVILFLDVAKFFK